MFSKVGVSVYIPTVVAKKRMIKVLFKILCICMFVCLGACNVYHIYAGA